MHLLYLNLSEVPQTQKFKYYNDGASNEIASWTRDGNHTLLTKYFLLASEEMPYILKIKSDFNPKVIIIFKKRLEKMQRNLEERNYHL